MAEVDGSFGDLGLQEHLADVETFLDASLLDLIGLTQCGLARVPRPPQTPLQGLRARVHVDVDGAYAKSPTGW